MEISYITTAKQISHNFNDTNGRINNGLQRLSLAMQGYYAVARGHFASSEGASAPSTTNTVPPTADTRYIIELLQFGLIYELINE